MIAPSPESPSGPALLALHGGLGWDHQTLRPWLDGLADHARLTYLDLPGCGAAPDPEDWSAVTHATLSEAVEADRARLAARVGGHERVILFGHSYGGIVALEVARRYPERVAGLVLCTVLSHAGAMPAAVERAQARDLSDSTREALGAALAAPPDSDEAFAAVMPDLLPLYVHRPDAHDLAEYAARVRFRAAPCRRSFYELLPTYDARPWLGEISVPALVLTGAHDWLAHPDESHADLVDGLPRAEGHVFAHSGHFPFMEEPEAFERVVFAWLDRQPAEATSPVSDSGLER